MATSLLWRITRQILNQQRTRAYQGHITDEDIEQLREFIDTSRANEPAHSCEAHLIRQEFSVIITFIGHGLELDDLKDFAILPRAFLNEKRSSTLVSEMQPDSDHQQQG